MEDILKISNWIVRRRTTESKGPWTSIFYLCLKNILGVIRFLTVPPSIKNLIKALSKEGGVIRFLTVPPSIKNLIKALSKEGGVIRFLTIVSPGIPRGSGSVP